MKTQRAKRFILLLSSRSFDRYGYSVEDAVPAEWRPKKEGMAKERQHPTILPLLSTPSSRNIVEYFWLFSVLFTFLHGKEAKI
jgi:hypothetical protein